MLQHHGNILSGKSYCPKCSNVLKKTTDIFKKEVFDLVGNEYTVLDEYKNASSYVQLRHNTCGYTYQVIANNFLRGRRCPKCSNRIPLTIDDIDKYINNTYNNEYKLMATKYINNQTKMPFKHIVCGNTFDASYAAMQKTKMQHCPYCGKSKFRTAETFKKEFIQIVGDEYSLLSDFTSVNNKILLRHNICGNQYSVVANSFLNGCRCPRCARTRSISKSEERISKHFKSKNVNYIQEYTFDDCVLKHKLLFDFYLPDYNVLIEYDGIQHFKPNIFGNTYLSILQRDHIKSVYCMDNNIPLLRIPYTEEDNIENILQKILEFIMNDKFTYAEFQNFKSSLDIIYPLQIQF